MYQTSESINELSAALATAQSQMDSAKKRATNPHFKSKYAKLEDILGACLPSLNENGLSISCTPCLVDGNDMMVCTLMHKSGQYLRSGMRLINPKGDMQGFGSACTYAKRYMVASVVGLSIDENDDDGNACANDRKITAAQAKMLEDRMNVIDPDAVSKTLAKWNLNSLKDLPAEHYAPLLKSITERENATKNARVA